MERERTLTEEERLIYAIQGLAALVIAEAGHDIKIVKQTRSYNP